jgi:hypothetical protein
MNMSRTQSFFLAVVAILGPFALGGAQVAAA